MHIYIYIYVYKHIHIEIYVYIYIYTCIYEYSMYHMRYMIHVLLVLFKWLLMLGFGRMGCRAPAS